MVLQGKLILDTFDKIGEIEELWKKFIHHGYDIIFSPKVATELAQKNFRIARGS